MKTRMKIKVKLKKLTVLLLAVVLSAFAIPSVIPSIMKIVGTEHSTNTFSGEGEGDAVTSGSFSQPFEISVYDTASGEVSNIEFEEYIAGVIAGEMPPSYHAEALRAQAVAARSYILSKIADFYIGKIPEEHHGAMVCTDYSHCQAWKSLSKARESWDIRYADDYENKIRSAVSQTTGEYMVYDNKVVKAFFCAMSNGKTENVEEVWGSSLPYLKSVSSREDIGADGYESMSSYPKDLFIQKLKTVHEETNIQNLSECISDITRTKGGSVSAITIGGAVFTGKEIRDTFGLRSASFEILTEGDKVTFRVRGYGHGVGMSQNGANVMAQNGKDYKDILKHYYSGISIVNLYKKA